VINELIELRQLLNNQKLSPAEVEALQQRKLRAVIRNAYEKVPYYRALFDSVGLHPGDIQTVGDLRHVPITTKADLRAAGLANIISREVNPSACVSAATSGSTGKPFTIYFSRRDIRAYRLNAFRALLSIGLRPLDRLAVFGITRSRHGRFFQRLGLYRSVFIHPQVPAPEQVRRLQQFDPTIFWFYPSALRALLAGINGQLSGIIRPRMLISASEVLDDNLRRRIQADLGVEIFNFYGAVEIGRISSECPAHDGLHISVDHVALECVDGAGADAGGKPGAALVTALNNFTMPLIRYRLGDICTIFGQGCGCGSSFPLMAAPIGREEEIIMLPNGESLSPHAFYPILREFTELDQFRLIQESAELLVLQLVWRSNHQKYRQSEIRAKLNAFLGGSIRLDIQNVDSIPEENLKFRAFISRLHKDTAEPTTAGLLGRGDFPT